MTANREDVRISLMGGMILVLLTVAAVTLTYLVMLHEAQSILKRNVNALLQNDAHFFQLEVERGMRMGTVVASRPFIIRNLTRLDAHPGSASAQRNLQRTARSFLPVGLSAVVFYDARGRMVAQAGKIANPPFVVPLKTRHESFLLWDRHPMVRTLTLIKAGKRRVGSAITQSYAVFGGKMAPSVRALGKSADLDLCARVAPGTMRCLPDVRRAHYIDSPVSGFRDGKPTPMERALNGHTGFVYTHDAQGFATITAYTPVPHTGLGMALTIRQSDLFRGVTERLIDVAIILLVLLLAGMFLMRWLILPILRRRTEAEKGTQAANLQLRNREAQIQGLLAHMADGVIVINEEGIVQIYNTACEKIFGHKSADVVGNNIRMLMPEPYRSEHDGYLRRYHETGEARVIGRSREVAGLRKNGEQFPLELRVSEVRSAGSRLYIATVRDITLEKEAAQQTLYLATHDALTQLPNRLLFGERLQHAIAGARRTHAKLALLFLDLDEFKGINDRLGHHVGDTLLQIVAQRLTATLRTDDTVSRLGGDEFVVILSGAGASGAIEAVAGKLLAAIRAPYVIHGHTLQVGTSIGIAIFPHDGEDNETLLKSGDTAMYQAKQQGGNRYAFFASAPASPHAGDPALAADWLDAHARGDLALRYQPVRSLATGAITSLEVLVMWPHPAHGQLDHNNVLRLAEQTGTTATLYAWILNKACLQWKAWSREGIPAPPLTITWASGQMQKDFSPAAIGKILLEQDVAPDHLIIGINEALITEQGAVADAVRALRNLGVQIAIDGFGSGLSSLTVLRNLSPQALKIDPWIVHGMTSNNDDASLITAIVALAHGLRMTVIAKGVENDAQRVLLGQLGCDEYQGDEWNNPLPAEEAASLLYAGHSTMPNVPIPPGNDGR